MKQSRILIYSLTASQLFIIIFFWLNTSGSDLMFFPGSTLIALGRLKGLLAVYFIFIQFVLRGRIMPLERIFGYETLNALHKKNGYVVFIFLLLHPLLITTGYSLSGKIDIFAQFIQLITIFENVWLAFIGWIMFMVIILSSIYIVRKRLKYELWYYVHFATYIAVILSWFHQLSVGTDFLVNRWFEYYWYVLYGGVFASVIYSRFIKILLLFHKHRFYVDKIEKETSDSVSVYIKGRSLSSFIFEPGQFLFARFFTKEFGMESHPFSFSSVPNADYFRLTVKNEGDFTAKLPLIKPGTKILIDGPHGAFTERFMEKDKIVYIAGGVGITPIRSLVEGINQRKEQILFYSNKTSNEIIFQKELTDLSRKHNFPIYNVISREESYAGIKGRINVELIRKYVNNLSDYDFYICGPVPMAKSIISELRSAGISSSQIHFEEFAL